MNSDDFIDEISDQDFIARTARLLEDSPLLSHSVQMILKQVNFGDLNQILFYWPGEN